MKYDNLYPHEWIAVMGMLLFLGVLIQFTWNAPDSRWPQRGGTPVPMPQEQVVVTITGAVAKEGRYHFPVGTTLGKALETVELLPEANASKMALDKPLKRGQRIRVPIAKTKELR